MTFETILRMVSDSPPPCVTHRFERHMLDHTEWGWRDSIGEESGWWWAISSGDRVCAIGWTSGDHLARNEEIRRAVAIVALPVLS